MRPVAFKRFYVRYLDWKVDLTGVYTGSTHALTKRVGKGVSGGGIPEKLAGLMPSQNCGTIVNKYKLEAKKKWLKNSNQKMIQLFLFLLSLLSLSSPFYEPALQVKNTSFIAIGL